MIEIHNGEFLAPSNAPYGAELTKAMWRRRKDGTYYTDDIQRVIPVVEYLDPSLASRLIAGAAAHARSTAKEASEGFIIPLPDGMKLYGFQEADVEFICNHPNTLLAEDAGLGKSAIMVAAANVLKPRRVLVVCPNIAKFNWASKELPKWAAFPYTCLVVNGQPSPMFVDSFRSLVTFHEQVGLDQFQKVQNVGKRGEDPPIHRFGAPDSEGVIMPLGFQALRDRATKTRLQPVHQSRISLRDHNPPDAGSFHQINATLTVKDSSGIPEIAFRSGVGGAFLDQRGVLAFDPNLQLAAYSPQLLFTDTQCIFDGSTSRPIINHSADGVDAFINLSGSSAHTTILIINYDILERYHKILHSVEWDFLIVDESHRIKNPDAKRTKFVLGGEIKVKKKDLATLHSLQTLSAVRVELPPLPSSRAVFATATPMNRPIDLWTMVQRCDPKGLGRDRRAFEDRYCEAFQGVRGRDVKGAAHLEELGALMRSSFMLRHDPKEVLDLPPLREDLFLLPPVKIILDGEEEFVKANLDALLGLAREAGVPLSKNSSPEAFLRMIGEAVIDNVSAIGKPEFAILFSKFALIRKETGIAKVPYVIDFINEKSDDGAEPIVVFGYHKDVMSKLREAYPDAAYVVGGMSSKMRNEMVDRFQNGETNHFLLNIDAGGEAITATRANKLIFAEMDWRGTAMIQARKRIHRITQVHACNVWYLAAAKSMDAMVANKAFSKMENIKRTLDL